MSFESSKFAELEFDVALLARIRDDLGPEGLAEHLVSVAEWARGSLGHSIWSVARTDPELHATMVSRRGAVCHRRFVVASNGHGDTRLVVADASVRQPKSAVYASFGTAPSPAHRGNSVCNYSSEDDPVCEAEPARQQL